MLPRVISSVAVPFPHHLDMSTLNLCMQDKRHPLNVQSSSPFQLASCSMFSAMILLYHVLGLLIGARAFVPPSLRFDKDLTPVRSGETASNEALFFDVCTRPHVWL